MAEEQKAPTPEEVERPHKCPFCDYRAKVASLLSRHINHHHPELKAKTPMKLLTVLQGKEKVSDMLVAVADFIDKASNFDQHLPDDVVEFLKREDAKVQLILRVIAIGKIQRALELDDEMKNLQILFKDKMKDANWKGRISPGGALMLMESISGMQARELNFLKELSQLGEVNLKDVIDKLVLAFGSAKLGSKRTGGVRKLELTEVVLPDDPAEREGMRRVLTHLIRGEEDESGGGTHTVEAEDAAGAGENPSDHPENR
jgi:hypothetical protein